MAQGRHAAKVNHTFEDPYILSHYGEFLMGLESVRALSDKAGLKLDQALARGEALTEIERGEVAKQIAIAKVIASRVGLDLTCRMAAADYNAALLMMGVIGALALLAGMVIAGLIAKQIAGSVGVTVEKAGRIANGDLTASGNTVLTAGRNELDQLLASLETMKASRIRQLRRITALIEPG